MIYTDLKVNYGDDGVITVTLDNDIVCTWDNNFNSDCPEDLTWGRMIGNVFFEGIEAGLKLAKRSKN